AGPRDLVTAFLETLAREGKRCGARIDAGDMAPHLPERRRQPSGAAAVLHHVQAGCQPRALEQPAQTDEHLRRFVERVKRLPFERWRLAPRDRAAVVLVAAGD